MGKDKAFDIYSWILSPEIREWMRKRPPMSITDQPAAYLRFAVRQMGNGEHGGPGRWDGKGPRS